MIRVGLVLSLDNGWLGGAYYYRNLIKAVNSLPDRELEFVVFVDPDMDNSMLSEFKGLEIVKTRLLKRFSLFWLFRQVITRLFNVDFNLICLLKRNKVDILSHSGWLGKDSVIPTIGWIPDFQHVHLPKFFTEKELKARDKNFLDVCSKCSSVIVSSYDALNDLRDFSPETVSKSVVMQFAVCPQENQNIAPVEELRSRYDFNGLFYLLPNQFWAHKNHKLVIESLGILKRKNISVTVLATGNVKDYRQPDHFPMLKKLIEDEGVADEIKILGIVPHSDLQSLFHYAEAIINPSFFEGWSTIVEEAKVLDKTVILSDINTHKEQNPEFGIYFNPNDAEQLAFLLRENIVSKSRSFVGQGTVAKDNFISYGASYQTHVKKVIGLNKDLP